MDDVGFESGGNVDVVDVGIVVVVLLVVEVRGAIVLLEDGVVEQADNSNPATDTMRRILFIARPPLSDTR